MSDTKTALLEPAGQAGSTAPRPHTGPQHRDVSREECTVSDAALRLSTSAVVVACSFAVAPILIFTSGPTRVVLIAAVAVLFLSTIVAFVWVSRRRPPSATDTDSRVARSSVG